MKIGFVVNDVATEKPVYTTTRLALAATQAPRSCSNARSPVRRTVGPVLAVAIPRAVEVTPSIPLTPRLPSSYRPPKTLQKHNEILHLTFFRVTFFCDLDF